MLAYEWNLRFSHIASQVFGVFYVGYLPSYWVRQPCGNVASLGSSSQAWLISMLYKLAQCVPRILFTSFSRIELSTFKHP